MGRFGSAEGRGGGGGGGEERVDIEYMIVYVCVFEEAETACWS